MNIRPFPLTQAELRELLDYDPETGVFRWKKIIYSASRVRVGEVAGFKATGGYMELRIARAYWKAHRVAWFWVHGEWPPALIDHINHDIQDNRICNLRLATILQNRQNLKRYKSNKSGYKGVYWHSGNNKWAAHISVNGKRTYLGGFEQIEDAAAEYARAAARLHTHNPDAALTAQGA